MRITCDFLVLGSGVAGLTFALEAAKHGEVVVVTKRGLSDSNTNWAQGGIAAVLDPSDSFEAHAKDTLTVGYGLSKPSVVDLVVKGGPAGIKKLIELGASFDEKDDKAPSAVLDGHALDYSSIDFSRFDLTREGGHTTGRSAAMLYQCFGILLSSSRNLVGVLMVVLSLLVAVRGAS